MTAPARSLQRRRPLRLLVAACAWAAFAAPAAPVPREQLEAAIVYNILPYVEWPQDAGPGTGAPLVLCVDPASRLSQPLRTLAGRPVREHRLEVQDLAPGDAARRCHAAVLDGSPRASGAGAAVRRLLRGQPVLVFGDATATAGDAVAVQLVEADGRIAFEVDMTQVREARLQINSRLLRLARKVRE